MTESEVDTHVIVDGARMHFQEWWTRHRAGLPALKFESAGIDEALPSPGVLEAISAADAVLIAPSNPVVSIGTILDVPGIREVVQATKATVVGVSPVIAGSVVRGMADACLSVIGVDTAADAIGRHYGARAAGGLLDAWLIAEEDADLARSLRADGLDTQVRPLWMRDAETSAQLGSDALDAAFG